MLERFGHDLSASHAIDALMTSSGKHAHRARALDSSCIKLPMSLPEAVAPCKVSSSSLAAVFSTSSMHGAAAHGSGADIIGDKHFAGHMDR